jgi:hypothetical protein
VLVGEVEDQAGDPAGDVIERHPAEGVRRLHSGYAELLQHPLHGGGMSGQEGEQRSTSDHHAPRRGHRAEAQPADADRVKEPHLAGDRDRPVHAQDHSRPSRLTR